MTELDDPAPVHKDISLLLSGGGFRATLFHLGVVRCLRERKLLDKVKQVYSVSGGSILAAHMAKHWNDYIGQEDQFDRATTELIDFTRQGIRESIIGWRILFWCLCAAMFAALATVGWILVGFQKEFPLWVLATAGVVSAILGNLIQPIFKPVHLLERFYRGLFGDICLADVSGNAPEFIVLGTNLTTGNPTCFTKDGVILDLADNADQEPVSLQIPLAACVAASSAFPPLFSPWIFNPRKHNLDKKQFPFSKYITDGGVFDNLGVSAAIKLSPNNNLILVSDAERRFDWATNQTFRFVVSRTSRAFDIVMNRVSTFSFVNWTKSTGQPLIDRDVKFLRLQDDLRYVEDPQYRRWKPVYTHTRQIRTDLDSFNEAEVQCLVAAGYLATTHWLDSKAGLPAGMRINEKGFPELTDPKKAWLPIKRMACTNVDAEAVFAKSTAPQPKLVVLKSKLFWGALCSSLFALAWNPISISFLRHFPIDISKLALTVEHVDQVENMKPFMAAIEPHEIDLVANLDLPRKQTLLVNAPMTSSNWFFMRRNRFSFSVVCDIRDSEIEYARAIIVDQDGDYFTYCQPMQSDTTNRRGFVCPETEGDQVLVAYVVVGTSEDAAAVSDNDLKIEIQK